MMGGSTQGGSDYQRMGFREASFKSPGEAQPEPPPKPRNTFEQQVQEVNKLVSGPITLTSEELMDRAKAFDVFRKSYRKNEAMEDNRLLLKEKYALGKKLGENVNVTRNHIKAFTNKIEEIRKENALRGMVDQNGEIMRTGEEDQL